MLSSWVQNASWIHGLLYILLAKSKSTNKFTYMGHHVRAEAVRQ